MIGSSASDARGVRPRGALAGRGDRVRRPDRAVEPPPLHGQPPGPRLVVPGPLGRGRPGRAAGAHRGRRRHHHADHRAARGGFRRPGPGTPRLGRPYAGRGSAAGDEMGELQRFSPALWGLAECALLRQDDAAAVALTEAGYAASHAVADAANLFPLLVTGTRARLAQQDPAAAQEWADKVSTDLLARGIPGTLPAVDHAAGLLQLAAGRTGKARELLGAAHAPLVGPSPLVGGPVVRPRPRRGWSPPSRRSGRPARGAGSARTPRPAAAHARRGRRAVARSPPDVSIVASPLRGGGPGCVALADRGDRRASRRRRRQLHLSRRPADRRRPCRWRPSSSPALEPPSSAPGVVISIPTARSSRRDRLPSSSVG